MRSKARTTPRPTLRTLGPVTNRTAPPMASAPPPMASAAPPMASAAPPPSRNPTSEVGPAAPRLREGCVRSEVVVSPHFSTHPRFEHPPFGPFHVRDLSLSCADSPTFWRVVGTPNSASIADHRHGQHGGATDIPRCLNVHRPVRSNEAGLPVALPERDNTDDSYIVLQPGSGEELGGTRRKFGSPAPEGRVRLYRAREVIHQADGDRATERRPCHLAVRTRVGTFVSPLETPFPS